MLGGLLVLTKQVFLSAGLLPLFWGNSTESLFECSVLQPGCHESLCLPFKKPCSTDPRTINYDWPWIYNFMRCLVYFGSFFCLSNFPPNTATTLLYRPLDGQRGVQRLCDMEKKINSKKAKPVNPIALHNFIVKLPSNKKRTTSRHIEEAWRWESHSWGERKIKKKKKNMSRSWWKPSVHTTLWCTNHPRRAWAAGPH